MYELLNKILTAGLETQDKVVDFLDDLVKKGKIDEKEREKFMENLDEKLLKARDKGEEFINEVTEALTAKNPFVARGDVDDLRKKVQNLEKKISKLEGKKKTTAKKATAAAEDTPEAGGEA